MYSHPPKSIDERGDHVGLELNACLQDARKKHWLSPAGAQGIVESCENFSSSLREALGQRLSVEGRAGRRAWLKDQESLGTLSL